ncbi:S46 family peptidase [Mesorhizobium sp. M1328]|uniref:S46 family peptidase n=1 Tax=Mesorhizobium sp. M1328 TaxID=2957082 RepID=UPI00333752B3
MEAPSLLRERRRRSDADAPPPSSVHKAGRDQSSLRVRIHPITQEGGPGLSPRRLSGGFLAKSLGEELPAAPGRRIYVSEDMRDVTAEMLKSVSDKLNQFARYERLATNKKGLIAACEGQPNRRCDVGACYGGASYYLLQKLEIEDVRLVYAPALGISNFGGQTLLKAPRWTFC